MKIFGKSPNGKARVLVVDDHPLVRSGVMEMINRTNDLICCGEAGDAAEARKTVAELKPDLILLDLRLDHGDGLELLKIFKAHIPLTKVLVLSQLDEMTYAERTLRAGARGYVMKEKATLEIVSAIRTVLAGKIFVSRKVKNLALRKLAGAKKHATALGKLTDRELQILQLLGRGFGTRQIATDLCLSYKTVQTHRENIKRKLRLSDAAALIHYATVWVRNEKVPDTFACKVSSSVRRRDE